MVLTMGSTLDTLGAATRYEALKCFRELRSKVDVESLKYYDVYSKACEIDKRVKTEFICRQ
jgi:hypothetical protein